MKIYFAAFLLTFAVLFACEKENTPESPQPNEVNITGIWEADSLCEGGGCSYYSGKTCDNLDSTDHMREQWTISDEIILKEVCTLFTGSNSVEYNSYQVFGDSLILGRKNTTYKVRCTYSLNGNRLTINEKLQNKIFTHHLKKI
jgi:hypothetical protein